MTVGDDGNRLGTKIPDLPAGLGDTGQLAAVCHLAEAHAGETELLEGTRGRLVDLVAVTHANGERCRAASAVPRVLLQRSSG